MATGKALDGKPYAGNPHVRFDEGEVAPAATPRRGSLLYKIISRKYMIFEKRNKKLNELQGNYAFADSHGMASALFLFGKWRITPWFKLSGNWSTYGVSMDNPLVGFFRDMFASRFRKLNFCYT